MTRAAVSFATMSAAGADIDRVATELRRRVAEVDRDLAATLSALSPEEVDQIRAARTRRDAAVAALCEVLEQLYTALGAAREAGLPSAYARPSWT